MFDMGMGMGMMDAGMMDMQMGMNDMGIGAMEFGMGAGMMDMGLMEMQYGMGGMGMGGMGMGGMGMGMGMGGMGLGMGMGGMGLGMGLGRGIGICPPGCMDSCCRVVVCPPNCLGPCCANRVYRCPPGCTGPCCVRQRVIIRNVPVNQINQNVYATNQVPFQQYNSQSNQNYSPQNNFTSNRYPKVDDIQAQKQIERQMFINRIKKDQNNELLKIQQEQLRLQRQELDRQKYILEQQKIKSNQAQYRLKQQQIQSYRTAKEQAKPKNIQYEKETIKQQKGPVIIFQGDLYQLNSGKWHFIQNAGLTVTNLLNIRITDIQKIKIKLDSKLKHTKLIKITTHFGETLLSVLHQDQCQWMCKIIWAKLASMGKICDMNEQYTGHIDGPILRKGFFSGWEENYGSISSNCLKISKNMNSTSSQITSVPEIWTRFDLMQGNMLIIKMHDSGIKKQIGIPLEHLTGWLQGLFTIIRP